MTCLWLLAVELGLLLGPLTERAPGWATGQGIFEEEGIMSWTFAQVCEDLRGRPAQSQLWDWMPASPPLQTCPTLWT